MRSQLTQAEEAFVRLERVARVATVDAEGRPHVVPVCPVLDGDAVVFATDGSAKVRNLRSNPACAVVFDVYAEDRTGLRQVQVRGAAEIVEDGPAWDRGKRMLDEKYPQYEPVAEIVAGESTIVRVAIEEVISSGFG